GGEVRLGFDWLWCPTIGKLAEESGGGVGEYVVAYRRWWSAEGGSGK
nr:hypothetical protein [Tanacetum cinerariifolium]